MSYSITDVTNDVEAALHGTTLNQIQNYYGLLNRAARDLILRIDPQETIRIVETDGPIFNGIWDYPIPSDLKGNRLIDIRTQITRPAGSVWVQNYNQDFDLTKNNWWGIQPDFTIQFNTSQKSLRINSPNLTSGVTISDATAITGNGTWAAGGSASNLQVDNTNFVVQGSSLSFDLAAAGSSGYLELTGLPAVDLSENLNQATQFLYTNFPTASDFTNVKLRWGSSSSDYYEVTATTTQQSLAFQDAWNTLAFPWLGATVTGSPDSSSITYLRVTWTYNGTAQTRVLLNGIQSILGRILEIEYYSKCLFRDGSTGAYKEKVTSENDLVNLDTESYQIYFNRVMFLITQQIQGVDATFHDGPFFKQEYEDGVKRYISLYKSQVQKPESFYYFQKQPGYSQYFGRRLQ